MEIKWYQTDFGYFTVVCDTEVYNTITAANASYLIPWNMLPAAVAVNSTIYDNVSPTLWQKCSELFMSVDYQLLDDVTEVDKVVDFTLAENRSVRMGYRYAGYPANFIFSCRGVLNGSVVTVQSSVAMYGYVKSSRVGGPPDLVRVPVFVADDGMTTFRNVVVTITAASNSYGVGWADGAWSDYFNGIRPSPPPFDDPDPYEEAGGGEDPLPGSEVIGLPSEPTLTPIDAGLFSLYSPTAAQMRNLANFLWTDFGGSGTTVEQVLEEVVEALKRSVSNPLNSMLGLSIIASQGLSKGSDSSVHVGFWNTGVSMTTITKQYFTVDCGSLSFSPVCGNTFLDYAPYSKFMIFLPYVGMRLLDANDVVGHTISIKYRGDCVSGALTCYVIRDDSVIQEHTGSCALNIPLTADSWAESISAVGRIISASAAGGVAGGAAGAAAGAVRGAASVATNPSALSSQVAHTGAVSGAAGHLGSQKPFILREAVRFHSTGNFNSVIGYPSYYYRKLGDCRGYTQCLEVHLNHTPCTGVELKEIEELLKKGVII